MRRRLSPGTLASVLAMVLMLSLALGTHAAAAQEDAQQAGDTVQEPAPPEPVATDPPPPPPTDPPATNPPPVATDPPPVATDPPVVEETPPPATDTPVTPVPTEPTGEGGIPPTTVPDGTEAPVVTETPTPSPTTTPTPPPPAALGLPWPYPGPMSASASGDISMIWGYLGFGVSQEYGRTAFSLAHPTWYDYGADYGLDGVSHPGLDVSMPRGTWLFSPVNGTVIVSGGSAGFTFYGNSNYGVGELRIRADDGNEVILGHMGRIAVGVGDYVTVGQFVGVSGGLNGDHLHLETRHNMGGWFQIVDPRGSFLVGSIADAATTQTGDVVEEPVAVAVDVATMPPLAPADVSAATGGHGSEVPAAIGDDDPATTSQAAAPASNAAESNQVQAQAQHTGQHVVTALAERVPEPDQPEPVDAPTALDAALQPLQESVEAQVAVLAARVTDSDPPDLAGTRGSP